MGSEDKKKIKFSARRSLNFLSLPYINIITKFLEKVK